MGQFTAAALSAVDCRIRATLSGVVVQIGLGVTPADPLGQRSLSVTYTTLDEALDDLPTRIRKYIADCQG